MVLEEKISAFEDHLKKFTDTCLKCKECKKIRNKMPLMRCKNYSTNMVLNQTQITHCQERLLKKATNKWKKNPKEVQEKTIYELKNLLNFVREAN
ncbi:hypothetical protein GDO81_010340 [Engystomops pustulosus]|uniref:Uncharacterized protein n=1 Tax=Engystomops pustulosus TaxID=76066 RepID=A0AAV7BZ50_ENGPU|nr:hypothetical protein GDO81_010340 [Engystomops pustulosus]